MVALMLYTSKVERTARGWVAQCAEVPGAISEARRLDQVGPYQREAIAWVTQTPIEDVEVTLNLVLAADTAELLESASEHQQRAQQLEHEAAAERRAAARELQSQGLPLRDIGTVLGVSHQRAHQLLQDAL